LLPGDAQRMLDDALKLGPGDQRSGQGDRADQRAEQRHDKLGDPRRLVAEQFGRRDRAGGAAAHAVVECDHLRHGRHRHLLAAPPGNTAAHHEGDDAEADIDQQEWPRRRADIEDIQEAGEHGGQHADAGDEDA
jgi:hypothetical protein